uniref:Reverse transcriptase domain-containing protein n=1 Tax=Tanacetum cinerariifolium TaxID=118510 RepID=A0A6L2LAD2_TANCI|nr:hypothetical protein [Tanacetum cinerariifolium]
MFCVCGVQVKEYQKRDKIGSKPDKNGKRGEAGKIQKQLQSIKKEKLKKMQKEGPKPQLPLNYESELGYIENYNSYPYASSSLPQQSPCCTRCGGPYETCQCDQLIFDEPYCKHCGEPHMNFQCQPMNHDSYNSNSLGFDQPQPPQSPVIHQPPQELSIPEMEDLKQQYLDELKRLSNLKYRDEIKIAELTENFNDQFEDLSESNNKVSSIDDDSFSSDNIDYVEASPPDSELFSSEVMEIVISEVGGIDDDILLTIKDDSLREKLLNVNLLIAKIEALNDNPTPSSDCKTKSSSTSLNSLLDTTTRPEISLSEYEAFYDDHVKEISSGSPTTHSDSPLYASFIFDLSINPFPPADRSDFYEFSDELIPFISPPEYDCFLFKVEPHSRNFTKDVVEDISPTTEPQVHNAFPTHPSLQLNMKFQPSSEYLFTYVVWIFLLFLVYSVAPHYLLSLRNEDTIFDPGICNSRFSSPDVSYRCGTVKNFNTHCSHLNECPMMINGKNTPILDVLPFHFYPP